MKKEGWDKITKGLIVVLELAAIALVLGVGFWVIGLILTAILNLC